MRSTLVTMVAIIFVLHLATSHEGGKSCKTPTGHAGDCRNIDTCELLRGMETNYGYWSFEIKFAASCDDDLENVCCPLDAVDDYEVNGVHDNNDDYDTGAMANTPYGPLEPPSCGTTRIRFVTDFDEPPLRIGYSPWIAVLGYILKETPNTIRWQCGGSLISSRHVLTAAHCVHNRNDLVLARLGDNVMNNDYDTENPIDVFIGERNIHPQFDERTRANDIAVLRLKDKITFTSFVRPVCLPAPRAIRGRNIYKRTTYVCGWRAVEFNNSMSRYSESSVVADERCEKADRNSKKLVNGEPVICMGPMKVNTDACRGNRGGSLMSLFGGAFYIIGIDSVGYKCNEPDTGNVYTKVTSFLDFVQSHLH